MDTNTLLIGVFTGALGAGYYVYGKNQQMIVPMLSGALLCIYPYFTDNIWILCSVGIFLAVLPFFVKL